MNLDRLSQPRTSTDDGFTLLEMLVVLSVLALTAVIAMPQIGRSQQGQALEAAAANLASEFKSARAAAIRSNTEQTLTIDAETRRYLRDGWSESRALPGPFDVALDTIRGEQTGLAAGRIRFYPDGSATGGRVVLRSGSKRAIVAIDWLTGGTRVSLEN